MECLTLFFFLIDIILRIKNYRELVSTKGTMPMSSNEFERKLNEDREEFLKRLRFIRVEIGCSAVAIIPFSIIFA